MRLYFAPWSSPSSPLGRGHHRSDLDEPPTGSVGMRLAIAIASSRFLTLDQVGAPQLSLLSANGPSCSSACLSSAQGEVIELGRSFVLARNWPLCIP